MPGYEVIAVDPNCFYSSDEDVDVEFDVEDDDNLTEILQEESKTKRNVAQGRLK